MGNSPSRRTKGQWIMPLLYFLGRQQQSDFCSSLPEVPEEPSTAAYGSATCVPWTEFLSFPILFLVGFYSCIPGALLYLQNKLLKMHFWNQISVLRGIQIETVGCQERSNTNFWEKKGGICLGTVLGFSVVLSPLPDPKNWNLGGFHRIYLLHLKLLYLSLSLRHSTDLGF